MEEERSKLLHGQRLSDDSVVKLLKLALSETARLLQRLDREDGEAWFREAAVGVLGLEPSPEAWLIEGKPDLASLDRLKRRCKDAGEAGKEPGLIYLAGYYLAVAAGLRHHGVLQSTVRAPGWMKTLLDLETGFREPWKTFFREARLALEKPRGGESPAKDRRR